MVRQHQCSEFSPDVAKEQCLDPQIFVLRNNSATAHGVRGHLSQERVSSCGQVDYADYSLNRSQLGGGLLLSVTGI